MKRVVTLDVLRGIAIFFVILSHVFIYVVDGSVFDPETGSLVTLIILSPLIILAKWRGFFLMISAASQIFSMHKGFQSNKKPVIIVIKQIINGILLLIVAYIFKIFLGPNATLYQFISEGVWDPSENLWIMQISDTLESIALSRILIAIIYYIMTLGKGLKKSFRNMIIFGLLGILSIALTPVMVQWVFNQTALTPATISYHTFVNSWKERIRRVLLANLIGWQQPLFPFISSAFFGAIYGIIFTRESLPKKKFLRTGFYISLGLVVIGLVLLLFSEDIIADFWDYIHPPWILLVNLGLQSMCILLSMRLIELNPDNTKIVRRLRFFRRFGMISLSIFCMELANLIPRWVFSQIFNIDLVTGRTSNMGILLLLVIAIVMFWSGIVWLWEFVRFYGSVEVFLRYFTGLLFWEKPIFKDPLNSRQILHDVEPISLLEPEHEKLRNDI